MNGTVLEWPDLGCPYDNPQCYPDALCHMCLEDGPAEGESQEAYDSRCAGVPRQGPI